MTGEVRKLGFLDIGQGKLGVQVQAAFEQAQISARDLNGSVSVTLRIEVYPPTSEDPSFGHVSYSIQTKEPPKRSLKYATLLQDGIIINDGRDQAGALQYELSLGLTPKV